MGHANKNVKKCRERRVMYEDVYLFQALDASTENSIPWWPFFLKGYIFTILFYSTLGIYKMKFTRRKAENKGVTRYLA